MSKKNKNNRKSLFKKFKKLIFSFIITSLFAPIFVNVISQKFDDTPHLNCVIKTNISASIEEENVKVDNLVECNYK
ncbi:MAG: hypothetical protein K2M17_00195 [Bacilli bacterium]|nr:hypothetical protein [Bacilli bacterium]